VESRDTHNIPSWRENAVTSRPEGKASKGMVDIWVGKSSIRRKGEKTVALYSITYFLITKNVPDPPWNCLTLGESMARKTKIVLLLCSKKRSKAADKLINHQE
jgi:hypothetical protein